MHYILQGITAMIVFLGLSTPLIVIGIVYYYKKRLEHQQIMAAIEKGIPLLELRPPRQTQNGALWIRSLTFGIAALIIGLALPCFSGSWNVRMAAVVLIGVGLAWIVRGILYRKYRPQTQQPDKNDTAQSKNPPGASTSETP